MKGTKYLSELIPENDFQPGALNLLVASCGSGKTTLFLDKLAGALADKHKMLYLIDTSIGNNYLIHKHRDVAKFYDDIWFGVVSQTGMFTFEERKVVIMTYAKFGWLVREKSDFGHLFEYIICDEFHNCFSFGNIPHDGFDAYRTTVEQLRQIAANGSTKVIAITATEAEVIKNYKAPIRRIPYDSDIVRRYETRQIIPYSDCTYWLNRIRGKGVIYTQHVEKMKELQRILGPRAIAIWSPNYIEKPMTDEQKKARDYIIEHEEIPDQYDYLIINKSMGTAITLRGKIDFMVVNGEEKDVVTQVRGRYRDDLDILYIKKADSIPEITVPPQYLGRKLDRKERDQLAALLSESISSKPIAWNTMEKWIIANGYPIKSGKSGKINYRQIDPISECSNFSDPPI